MQTLKLLMFSVTALAVIWESPLLRKLLILALLLLMAPQAFCQEDALPSIPRYSDFGNQVHDSGRSPDYPEPPRFQTYSLIQRHDYGVVGEPLGGYSQSLGGDQDTLGE